MAKNKKLYLTDYAILCDGLDLLAYQQFALSDSENIKQREMSKYIIKRCNKLKKKIAEKGAKYYDTKKNAQII